MLVSSLGTTIPEGPATAWRSVLGESEARLRAAGVDAPAVDARRIVEEATGWPGAELSLHLDEPVTSRTLAHHDAMVERRLAGEPLQYVLGSWGFRQLDLHVDGRVLIPRPETEGLVTHALSELDRVVAAGGPALAVDLGTGSGAIALSIAVERPGVEVVATDVSSDAVDVARANLAGLGHRGVSVTVELGDWFDALDGDLRGRIAVIATNPPYVALADDLPAEVADWEPAGALVAGRTGLEAIEAIVGQAPGWLAPAGALVVEIAPAQAAAAIALAVEAGLDEAVVHLDGAGDERVLVARMPAPS